MGSPELLALVDEKGDAPSLLPALGGGAFWGPPSSDLAAVSHVGGVPPNSSASFFGAPPTSGALSYTGWGEGPSQSLFVPSPAASQGASVSQSFLVPSPPPSQGGLPPLGVSHGVPARDPSPTEIGKGIFLCERIVLEYSGDCQLPAEVRLALKHPHGYKIKGPHAKGQGGAPSRQSSDLSVGSERRSSIYTRGTGEDGDTREGAPCKCSDCGPCRAVAEARSILSPFGLHLRLGGPPSDRAPPRRPLSRSASRGRDTGSRKGTQKQGAPLSLALTCLSSDADSSPAHGGPSETPGAPIGCVCALFPSETGPSPSGEAPASLAGHLVYEALTPREQAAVEAAAAVKRALTYFVLEAPPPAAAGVVRVGPPRAPGQKDLEGPLQQHAKAGPLAAVKLLPQQQEQQQLHGGGAGNSNSSSSSSSSSSGSGGEILKSSSSSSGVGPPEDRPRDSQGALMGGLIDAIMQLHDISSLQDQAAVSTNHFAALLSNQRAVVTYASKAFQ